ncbi:MAG: hypothetical protein K2O18_18770 [Oscillospiraceae bacterium]|nr:hypothetical protein [Oscillospiraceae bacterium]
MFDGHSPEMLLWPLAETMTAAALVTDLVEAICREIAYRTECRLLEQRVELAQSSYDIMRRQHE